ncbi:MAG: T9SS type A sorting domain-containing protein [Bacteroidetes bacterium]|nr:T9SS type A sorting domain-containing protein [Bacteroidota bacterium]
MNKALPALLLSLFSCTSLWAQIFPFDEGFHGITTYTLPAGWSGDMSAQPYHGLNDEKGLVATIGSTDRVDSALTPWIGPLAPNTEFIFWYRMVDDFIFPSTQRDLRDGDKLELMLSTDSINYTTIYLVDSSNHIPNTNFKKITFTNTNFGGQIVKLKLRAQHCCGGSYYVDIDSIKIREKFVVGINETETSRHFSFYPNPVSSGSVIRIMDDLNQNFELALLNCLGEKVYTGKADTWQTEIPAPLVPGIYFLQYGNITRKLVVQ